MNKNDIKDIKTEIQQKFGIVLPIAIIRFIGKIFYKKGQRDLRMEKARERQRILESNLGYDD